MFNSKEGKRWDLKVLDKPGEIRGRGVGMASAIVTNINGELLQGLSCQASYKLFYVSYLAA
jgi:hypothetical protein